MADAALPRAIRVWLTSSPMSFAVSGGHAEDRLEALVEPTRSTAACCGGRPCTAWRSGR